jgi:hypothetical protein
MCVVHAPAVCKYVALSCIDTDKSYQLNMDTYKTLCKPNALLAQDVPRTFADAIDVTRLFSCRYLWVEALCIVQDGDDKRQQLQQKGRIFEASSLVIISADGLDPEWGLTGASPRSPRAARQTLGRVGGFRWAVMSPPLHVAMDDMPWSEDGDLYTGVLLSKRVLVFTPTQVYYRCKLVSYSEDTHFIKGVRRQAPDRDSIKDHPLYQASGRHWLKEQRDFRLPQHWFSYAPLVEDYSPRRHANVADVLKAIQPVLSGMTSPRMETYICALPTTILEWALMWQPVGEIPRRPCSARGFPFPSWSWIGWIGATKMPHYDFHPTSTEPAISGSFMFLTPAPSARREEPEDLVDRTNDYVADEVHRDLLPFRPEAVPISQEMPFQATRWVAWDRVPDVLSGSNPFYNE